MRFVFLFFYWVILLATTIILTIGSVGGIMYLNEKLNQYGTILIGG